MQRGHAGCTVMVSVEWLVCTMLAARSKARSSTCLQANLQKKRALHLHIWNKRCKWDFWHFPTNFTNCMFICVCQISGPLKLNILLFNIFSLSVFTIVCCDSTWHVWYKTIRQTANATQSRSIRILQMYGRCFIFLVSAAMCFILVHLSSVQ